METEAALLSGTSQEELEDLPSYQGSRRNSSTEGVQHVVITLGARGVYYSTANGDSEFVPALQVKAIDTTAAGDTFIGAYAVAFVEATSRTERFDAQHGSSACGTSIC